MRPGLHKKLDKTNPIDALVNKVEHLKASIRAKVEHPFRVTKRQFGFVKVRYRGLKKNTAQLTTLFALSNLWMARGKLMAAAGRTMRMRAPGIRGDVLRAAKTPENRVQSARAAGSCHRNSASRDGNSLYCVSR